MTIMLTSQTEVDYDWRHRLMVNVAVDPQNNTIPSQNLVQYVPVDLVRNGVTYIILYSMFATLLFVLLCAVLFKNGLSPQKRRLPVVWVLGLSMLGGLLGSTLNTVFWAYQLFGTASDDTMFRLWESSTATLYIVPLLFHIAIQLRLMTFYPATLASRRKRIAISIVPTAMKIARLTTISITLQRSTATYHRTGFSEAISQAANDKSNLLTLIFQLVDTTYASILLLWRYWSLGRRRDSNLVNKKSHAVIRWMKQFLFALAFGFVLPTLYALALVVSSALDIKSVDMGFMLVANVYVQAFGAVLATLSRSYRWREDMFTDALATDNAVVPGMRDSRHGSAAAPFELACAMEANISEVPSARPKFLSMPFTSHEQSHRRPELVTPSLGSSEIVLSPSRTVDHASLTSNQGGDVSPKTSNARVLEGRSEDNVVAGTADAKSLRDLSYTSLPQLETRRSSDATLFAPPAADKTDGLTRKVSNSSACQNNNRPGSRPGSAGNGWLQRLGSSRSVLPDGLKEEEESPPAAPHPTSDLPTP